MPLSFRLAAFYFAFFAHAGAYVAYFPLYLSWRGLGAIEIAWVLALPQLARIFAPAVWGWLADAAAPHRAIVAFACASSCRRASPCCRSSSASRCSSRLMSLLSAGALPLVEAITLGSLAGRHGAYGPIRVWGSVGFIAVVLAGGLWLDYQPVSALPAAIALFMLAALAVALALPRTARHAAPQPGRLRFPSRGVAAPRRRLLHGRGAWRLYAFLTLHLEREGYSGTMIGVLWTLGVVAEILVFLFLPQLFRRYALSTILVASCACGVARFLALGWGAGALWLVAARAVAAGGDLRRLPCGERGSGAPGVPGRTRRRAARRCSRA